MVPCRNPVSLDALHRRRTGVGLLLRWCVPRFAENLSAGRVVATSICVRCPHPCLPLIKATTACHTLTSVSLSRRPSLISRLSLPRLYLLVLFSLPSAFLRISETLEFVEIRHASLKNGSWFSRRNTQISVGVHSAIGGERARGRQPDREGHRVDTGEVDIPISLSCRVYWFVLSRGNTQQASCFVEIIMPEATGGGRRQRGRESIENELRSLSGFYRWGRPRSPRPPSPSRLLGGGTSSNPPCSVTKRSRRRRRRGNINRRDLDNIGGIASVDSSWQEAAADAVVAGFEIGSGSGGGRGGNTSPIAR